MSKTIKITNENFQEEVLESKTPILIDFWAPWCQPCLMMAPVLDELSEELGDKLKIGKLNTETPGNQFLATQYQIQSIPNLKLFKNGEVVKEFVGLRPKEIFKQELESELEIEK